MTVNLHLLLKIYPDADSCKLQGIPMVPRFAVSRYDVAGLLAGIRLIEWQLKSHIWSIYKGNSSMDRTSGDVCLNRLPESYMKYRLSIKSWRSVSISITNEMADKLRFDFVRVDQMYEPWYKQRSWPPCSPYHATSSMLPNKNADKQYHGQKSEKEHFAPSAVQIWQLDNAVHMSTS